MILESNTQINNIQKKYAKKRGPKILKEELVSTSTTNANK